MRSKFKLKKEMENDGKFIQMNFSKFELSNQLNLEIIRIVEIFNRSNASL